VTDEKRNRSAETGEFVSDEFAEEHPDTTVRETIEYPDPDILLSEQDKADLEALNAEEDVPPYHTILESWREVLRPAAKEGDKRPTPQWCNKLVASYIGLTYADMYNFRDLFFSRIGKLLEILEGVIDSDDECLHYTSAEEDRAENAKHYKEILKLWQLEILRWELDWDCLNPDAAADLASISEVHKMFFEAGMGLVQWLENIQLNFTEADQTELALALKGLQEEVNGE
jgi:hypothetical protein